MNYLGRLSLVKIASSIVTVLCFATGASGITVETSGLAWPTSAEVLTSPSLDSFRFTDSASAAPFTLTQTFQSTATFDAQSLFVFFGGNADADFTTGLTIFAVDDVNSPTIPIVVDPANILLDTTFVAPPEPDETVAQLFLDSPLTIPATAGTAGYAVRFTSDREFRWERSSNSSGAVSYTHLTLPTKA